MSGPLGDVASFAVRWPRAVSPAGTDCAEAWGAAIRSNPTAMLMPRTDIVRNKSLSCLPPQQLRNSAVASGGIRTGPISETCRYNREIANGAPNGIQSRFGRPKGRAIYHGQLIDGSKMALTDRDRPAN